MFYQSMTEQAETSEIQQTVRFAEAQAIAHMGESGGGGILPDPKSIPFTQLTKSGVARQTTFIECPFATIELAGPTGGSGSSLNWQQLTYANDLNNAGTGFVSYATPFAVPFNLLLNLACANARGSSGPPAMGQSDVVFWFYQACRLHEVEFTWKDFMFTVERTASGGVQFKDEPVLEIAYIPTDPDGTSYPSGEGILWTQAAGPFSRSYHFGGGWGSMTDVYATQSTTTGTVYRALGDWFTGVDSISFAWDHWRRPTMLNGLNESAWIRCRNIPLGLTNVQVNLKYTVEVKAKWEFMYYNTNLLGFVPSYWTPSLPPATGMRADRKKRKVQSPEPE